MDTTTCPHCGGQAQTDFQTRTGDTTTFCDRCGYYHDDRDGPASAVQTPTGVLRLTVQDGITQVWFLKDTDLSTLRTKISHDDTLASATLRVPPLYRTEFLRGEPDAGRGEMTEAAWAHLTAALAPHGEVPHALVGTKLYTRSQAGDTGYRVLSVWQDEDGSWDICLPGDSPPMLRVTEDGAWPEADLAGTLVYA